MLVEEAIMPMARRAAVFFGILFTDGHAFCGAFPKPARQMILYKYRSDSEFTRQIFTKGKVWLSTAAQLNDPFEASMRQISPDWSSARVKEMKSAQVAGFLDLAMLAKKEDSDFFGLSSLELTQLLAKFRQIGDVDRAHREYREFMVAKVGIPSDPEDVFARLEEQLQAVGIFSLSEDSENPLMWAHYSGDHKGLCLGFEVVDGSRLANQEHCLKVVYADSIPKIGEGFRHQITLQLNERGQMETSSRIAFSDPAVQAAISTKPVCWSYEREWRYVEPCAGEYSWPGLLVEIVFGLRCSAECRARYSALASEFVPNDVRVYEMKKVADSNSLERLPLPSIARTENLGGSPAVAGNLSGHRNATPEASVKRIGELMESGQVSAALTMLGPMLENNPENAQLWNVKGIALGISKDHDGALQCFGRAIDINTEFFSAWYHKGVSLTALGRYQEAVTSYERAGKLNQGDASTAFNLGAVLCELERWDEAIARLRNAEELGHPRARYLLQEVLQRG